MNTYQRNRNAVEQALDTMTAVGAPAIRQITGTEPANPHDPAELINRAMDWWKAGGQPTLEAAGITFQHLNQVRRIRNAAAHRLPEVGNDAYIQQSIATIKALTHAFGQLTVAARYQQDIAQWKAEAQRQTQRADQSEAEVQRLHHLAEGRRTSLQYWQAEAQRQTQRADRTEAEVQRPQRVAETYQKTLEYWQAEAHRLKPIAQHNMTAAQRWEAEAKRWQAEAERLIPIAQRNFRAAEQQEAKALKWRRAAAFQQGQCHQLTGAPDTFAARSNKSEFRTANDWKVEQAYYQGRCEQANANGQYADADRYRQFGNHAYQMSESRAPTHPDSGTGSEMNQDAINDMIAELVPQLSNEPEPQRPTPRRKPNLLERLRL